MHFIEQNFMSRNHRDDLTFVLINNFAADNYFLVLQNLCFVTAPAEIANPYLD